AHALDVPFASPPNHPFNSLLALRVASIPRPPAERRALIDALYAAVWAGQGGVESVDAVANAVTKAGLEPEPILAEAQSAATKALLRKNTDEAVARGVFGVPTAIVDGELFWGTQSF